MKLFTITLFSLYIACLSPTITSAQEWAKTYNGSAKGLDLAKYITMDANKNVYVTGESWGGDATETDIVTIKYDNNGNQKWAKRYDGLGHRVDYPVGMVTDKAGNVYVAGLMESLAKSPQGTTDKDIVLIKYDPTGKRLWVKTYGGSGKKDDYVGALVIDSDDSLYLVGAVIGKAGVSTLVILKYTPSGVLVWSQAYLGIEGIGAGGSGLTMDANFLYVIGGTRAKQTGDDFLTLKCSKTGSIVWAQSLFSTYSDKKDITDYPTSVVVDPKGNVYVVGSSVPTYWKWFFVKYSPQGKQLWSQTMEDHDQNDYPKLGLDKLGNIYILQNRSDKVADNFVVRKTLMQKYSPAGTLLWQKLSESPEVSFFVGSMVDSDGNIYFTGRYTDSKNNVGDALYTMKYSTEGKRQWTKIYAGSRDAVGFALCVDSLGNAYVTGVSTANYITLKFAP